jgi:hypothetical protein
MKLYEVGRTVLDAAWRGGLLAAGGALVVFTLAPLLELMRRPPADRLLLVLGNYFIVGAVLGGLVGLALVLWRRK